MKKCLICNGVSKDTDATCPLCGEATWDSAPIAKESSKPMVDSVAPTSSDTEEPVAKPSLRPKK